VWAVYTGLAHTLAKRFLVISSPWPLKAISGLLPSA
jgi:hypothetical protein